MAIKDIQRILNNSFLDCDLQMFDTVTILKTQFKFNFFGDVIIIRLHMVEIWYVFFTMKIYEKIGENLREKISRRGTK